METIGINGSRPRPGEGRGDTITARRAVMALTAKATAFELKAVRDLAPAGVVDLRPPETGLVMLRGRIGGSGAAFNLGEATVSRAAVRLPSGATGFGHVLGRDRHRARDAALVDALWIEGTRRDRLENEILAPLAARIARDEKRRTAEVAATRVDFFTLVRGAD
ncbi:MAG: phosphonate C-P lyase system protein PhnG [Siculibacillus sp.]|nr:phosphonate C-P lyase system protein PhnG [Siculibacillus sp.]